MLFLQFYINEFRYVLPTKNVVEIVPGIKLTDLPKMPPYVAGLMNYRGNSVPVIDLCFLFLDRKCENKLSTRMILMKINGAGGRERIIGFFVEKATETIKVDETLFKDSGIRHSEAPCLGPVMTDAGGLITLITPQNIFSQIDESILYPKKACHLPK
jgi:chemotaxis-related protein WspB